MKQEICTLGSETLKSFATIRTSGSVTSYQNPSVALSKWK